MRYPRMFTRAGLRLLLGIGLGSMIGQLAAAAATEAWRVARSPHFELLTEQSDEAGADTLRRLETFRHAVTARLNLPASRRFPVTVIVFAHDADYGPFKPHSGSDADSYSGHLYQLPDRVVLAVHANVSADLFEAQLYHLLAHALLTEAGFRAAPWLDEGLAAAIGSFQVEGDHYAFRRLDADSLPIEGVQCPLGHRHPSFVEEYRTMHGSFTRLRRLVEFSRVIADGNGAADIHAAAGGNFFYLQSWLLAHYCLFSDERLQFGPRLLRLALSDAGDDAVQLRRLERTLGEDERKLRRRLERYYESGRWTDLKGPVPLGVRDLQPTFALVATDRLEVELAALATWARSDRADSPALRALAETTGAADNLPLQEALASAAWRRGDDAAGLRHAERAVALGTLHSTCFTRTGWAALEPHLATLRRAGTVGDAAADALRGYFERALALDPGDDAAMAGLAWVEAIAQTPSNENINRVQEALAGMRFPDLTLLAVATIRWRIGDRATADAWIKQLSGRTDWDGAALLTRLQAARRVEP